MQSVTAWIYENRYYSLSNCFILVIHNLLSKKGIYLKFGFIVALTYKYALMKFQLDKLKVFIKGQS